MKLSIDLKNCYGINKLVKDFDFSKNKTFLVYASNGVMKTSFARTFVQLQKGEKPKEEVHNRTSEWNITIDSQKIQREEIFVIKPYIQKYQSENVSTLLVDETSKAKYEEELKAISKNKVSFLSTLNKKSGKAKNEIENIILNDFKIKEGFFAFLQNIDFETINSDYSDIKYSYIFEDKVLELLKTEGIKENISQYTQKYTELIQEIPYFDKGLLNPSRADNVLKALQTNKFFSKDKDNLVKLNGEDILLNESDLKKKFIEAKNKLVQDEKLKQIQDLITKNAKVEAFQTLLENNPEIINELNDLDSFKKKIWNSYFVEHQKDIEDLLSLYNEKKSTLEEIENKANIQKTRWIEVVKTFEQRFKVPFKIDIKDHKSAILGKDTPVVVFKFWNEDKKEYTELNRDSLEGIEVLSQGERRALYLLNIIFEIETRVENNTRTLFIIDDIADSFDYRNKYAIIEYLKEIPKKAENRFYQIILTHNFDFFRTVHSGLNLSHKACYIANRTTHSIELDSIEKLGIISPFKKWKNEIQKQNTDFKYFIAMIPFARELASYLEKSQEDKEGILNALLHVQDKTKSITIDELKNIYKCILGLTLDNLNSLEDSVFSIMLKVADKISNENLENSINLENKVVLSIVTRLKAEYYMQNSDIVLEKTIGRTFEKYKDQYKTKTEVIKLLEQVVIMTPENIHLNSFMYEPILDMSDSHLKKLYKDISVLYDSIESNDIKDVAGTL